MSSYLRSFLIVSLVFTCLLLYYQNSGFFVPPIGSSANLNTSILQHPTRSTPFTSRTLPDSFLDVNDVPLDMSFLDSSSITGIFPVTETTIHRLLHIIAPFLSDRSPMSALVLVCPSKLIPAVGELLDDSSINDLLDIFLISWPEGLDEGAALLATVKQASTEYVLVMGSDGLTGLDEETRAQLLSHALFQEHPSGYCGGRSLNTTQQISCVPPLPKSVQASFLLPPFVLSTLLVRSYDVTTGHEPGKNIWSELGDFFLRHNGIDSIVHGTDKESNSAWCLSQCEALGMVSNDSIYGYCPTAGDSESENYRNEEYDSSKSLTFVLQSVSSLKRSLSMICSFTRRGYHLHILVLAHGAVDDSSSSILHEHINLDECRFPIPYDAILSAASESEKVETANIWLQARSNTISVVIYGIPALRSITFPIDSFFERLSNSDITIIKIPEADLPYCDWIGFLSTIELKNWAQPVIDLTIITDDRPKSLGRLLDSLTNARYFGDTVSLRINLEQSADPQTRNIVEKFNWSHGAVFVHHRVNHGGLLTAVVESWFPHTDDTYGVLLEDDVEVSPLFYAWVKMALLRYRYGISENKSPNIFGISLYQQRQNELDPDGRRHFDASSVFESHGIPERNTPYLSQVPCSWGAVYFPEHWREFHIYMSIRLSDRRLRNRQPVVPHVRSNRWAHSWKRYFIELAFLRGYTMLYPNYPNFLSLSTNHLEPGSHVKEQPPHVYEQKKALFTVPLMPLPEPDVQSADMDESLVTSLLELPNGKLPRYADLPVLDLLGELVSGDELRMRGIKRQEELFGCTTVGSAADKRQNHSTEELFSCGIEDDDNDNDYDMSDDETGEMYVHYEI